MKNLFKKFKKQSLQVKEMQSVKGGKASSDLSGQLQILHNNRADLLSAIAE